MGQGVGYGMGKLTQLRINRLGKPGRYGDGDGLWLQVRDMERRAWLFRYRRLGRARAMGLGPLTEVSLAEARDAASECRRLLRQGIDPIEQRRNQKVAQQLASGRRFRDVVDLYIAAHESSWRNEKHRAQWRSTLETYAIPKFGNRAVASIDTGDVTSALEPIWTKLPETAGRLRGRIEAVLDFAKARGWRDGENPARWRGHLSNLLANVSRVARIKHHPALPYVDVGSFMSALRKQSGVSAKALDFAILTAARTGEVIGARWSEVDLKQKLWTVPADRMKSGKEHRVPLSGAALEILREMSGVRPGSRQPADFVFPGRKNGLSNMSLTAVLKRMKRDEITVHGFRSTFRDWAAEQTAYPREVAEAALAHTLSDRVEAAYRRGDLLAKRAQLMSDWARYCAQPRQRGNVVPIRQGRR